MNYSTLDKVLEKVIDYRGRTPKKLGLSWSINKKGYRALSANNVKTSGLEKTENINYGSQELYDIWMKDEIKRGDILLTSEAPAGEVMVWDSDEKIILSQRLYALRVDKSKVSNFFLKYYLQSGFGQKEITKNNSGSTVLGISAKTFSNIRVILPDLETQTKIASVLSALDDKIELNNRINAQLEQLARTLYDYWFVQFDFPNGEGKPYRASGGKMKFSPELNREIPEGWEVKNFKENRLFELFSGKVEKFAGTKKYITTSDITDKEINLSPKEVFFENRESRANCQPEVNTVWFAKMKSTKKLLMLGENSHKITQNYILSTGFQGLKMKKADFLEYVWLNIDSDIFEKKKDEFTTGSTQKAITQQGLAQISILVPTDEILQNFSSETKALFEKVYKNKLENQKLAELRDWLLPLLMSGQVQIKN